MKAPLSRVQLSGSRPTIPETVNSLAASMKQLGLLNPIIVKRGPIFDGAAMTQGFKVIAGNHRVSAARALGWTEIEAFVDDGDDLALELAEIDENLMRTELTPAQRADAVARRREIWQAMHPDKGDRQTVTLGGKQTIEFATDTQRATGEDRRRTNEHLSRADKLGPDLHAVIGTSLDKAGELDALKEMTPEERRPLIEAAQRGEKVSAKSETDTATVQRLVTQAIGEIARLRNKLTPEEVADAMQTQAIDPDLKPYIEAIYNAYRAAARRAA